MNAFTRWCKFNAVGAMGMVLQLAALAVFNRIAAGRYLCASAVAVELTLLHNFVWHVHYTWRDRSGRSTIAAQLVRFHLSNGAVSLLGNLALMRILVHGAHLPLLIANGIAIFCCSVLNFLLSDGWAFARHKSSLRRPALQYPAQSALSAADRAGVTRVSSGSETESTSVMATLAASSHRIDPCVES